MYLFGSIRFIRSIGPSIHRLNSWFVMVCFIWLSWLAGLIQEGCFLHRILPRVLQHLAEGSPPSKKGKELDELLRSVGFDSDHFLDREREQVPNANDADVDADADAPDGHPQSVDDWVSSLVQSHDGEELSYAELNQKRKQLTFQAFQEESFLDKCKILDDLVRPNLESMYRLFQRTGFLSKLCYLPKDDVDTRRSMMSQRLALQSTSIGVIETVTVTTVGGDR